MGTHAYTQQISDTYNTHTTTTNHLIMSVHDILANVELIKKDKSTITGHEALKGKKKVLVYFSAHWCPPCRMFTPMLKEAYDDDLKEANVEIVFVSSDQDADGAFSYFSNDHADWLLAPHGCAEAAELKKLCQVRGIPTLAMFNEDGSLNTVEARNIIASGNFDKITK